MATHRLQQDDERLYLALKALGNPVRLQIVRFVKQHPGCIGNEILLHLPDNAPQAQSTISQHMRVLREAGLVEAEPEGPAVCYWVRPDAMAWLREQLSDLV